MLSGHIIIWKYVNFKTGSKQQAVADHSSPREKVLVHNKQQARWAGLPAEKSQAPAGNHTPDCPTNRLDSILTAAAKPQP
jgi:hypothetical protein